MKTDPARSKILDQSVPTATTVTANVDVSGYREMTVIWRLMATTTPGDLTLNDAIPYVEDPAGTDVLITGTPLPPPAADAVVAPVSDGSNVVAIKRYRVAGLKTVQIRGRNNNAGSKTLKMYVHLTP